MNFLIWFKDLSIKDVLKVGGKNASLGEMYQKLGKKGVRIPNGFATTSDAYWRFMKKSQLGEKIENVLKGLDVQNVKDLYQRGQKVRNLILKTPLDKDFERAIAVAYQKLSQEYKSKAVDVAVRSSATAEDSPEASFAGQMETYLNIRGIDSLLKAVHKCMASLFTNRAIVYRATKGFKDMDVALSVGIQKMIRSDLACSGVMFSCDTESGFADITVINSSWGLGENIVQGKVSPDEFMVFEPLLDKGYKPIVNKRLGRKEWTMIYNLKGKSPVKNIKTISKERNKFTLSDEEILELARYSVLIEKHYKRPMDMEWGKDGKDNKLYILQARPETVQSRKSADVLERYILVKKEKSKNIQNKIITTGVAVGSKIGQGSARVIKDVKDIVKFKPREVLVTEMTDPDWVPIMKIASAIVTNAGGRTCFAGDTKILTNKGFLPIKKIVEKYKEGNYKVLSLNKKTLKMEWKRVIDGMGRDSVPICVDFSQTGRMRNNTLEVTPDHKFLTFKNRKIVSKEIRQLLKNEELILSPNRIPLGGRQELKPELGYLLGGISTDGHICLRRTHGEIVFIQKPTPEKLPFINKMNDCLKEIFDYSFHVCNRKPSTGIIRGKPVHGMATSYRCYSKSKAVELLEEQNRLTTSLLESSEEFVYNFLAGVIDGDGTYSQKRNRINIFCSKEFLFQAIITACLRLNVSFQVSSNRNIHNIQLVDGIEKIFKYTKRVSGEYKRVKFGTRFFAAKQLLDDIKEKVNYRGRIKLYINKNLLIDVEKIRKYIIPMITGQTSNHELTRITDSDIKMLRVNFVKSLKPQMVYNITVENNHNYVVFTKRYTPVVVNNCHAAIVSRELGVPCIVGTGNVTKLIKDKQKVTVSCSEGEIGRVYNGLLPFKIKKTFLKKIKNPKTKVMLNLAEPSQAFGLSFLPNDGVGLAREEFIINDHIKIHPLALLNYSKLKDQKVKKQIDEITAGYKSKTDFYVNKLAEGIGTIASAFYPKDVIVRFSDFKSNEYANLIGGTFYEPQETNPMIGWRGASRYNDPKFKKAFEMECQAIKKVRQEFGLDNVIVMVPFCRTIEEAKGVLKIIDKYNLREKIKGQNKLQVYVMAEIPSNIILAEEFAKLFDGFSIGSNDLTQLVLGLDRDSSLIAHLFDERNEAVKKMIRQLIKVAHKHKRKVGICGQGPSDFSDFAQFLVREGIDSISLLPDTIIETTIKIAQAERK